MHLSIAAGFFWAAGASDEGQILYFDSLNHASTVPLTEAAFNRTDY